MGEIKKEEIKEKNEKAKRSSKSKVITILLCISFFCIFSILLFVIFGRDLLPFSQGENNNIKQEEKKEEQVKEYKEVNLADNEELKRNIVDEAANSLAKQNKVDPEKDQNLLFNFGYIFTRKDGKTEALFELIFASDKVFYMALQDNKLILLNFDEETYRNTVQSMINEHECLRDNKVSN